MSFWETYAKRRVTRRRALVSFGAAAGSAAFLAACGGDDGDSPSGGSSDGGTTGAGGSGDLLYKPADTSGQAKTGGTLKIRSSALSGAGSLDLIVHRSGAESGPARDSYPGLLKFKVAKAPEIPEGDVEGDIVDNFEVSGDGLEITMKLRSGLHWDQRAPTNGREIDADDVLATWERFKALSPYAGAFVYSADSPVAPIESMTAVDKSTVLIKLHQPNSAVMAMLAQSNGFPVMPQEASGAFNPETEVRGYGPYSIEEYDPAIRTVWVRNPDYHVQDRPFIERIEETIIPEYTSALAQFRAGNVYTNVIDRLDDILPTKKDIPELLLSQSVFFDLSSNAHLRFGYNDDSPFRDQRVRQAISMLINRESYIDLLTSRNKFQAEGIDVEYRMPTALPAGFEGAWLDPTSSDFGPNAKYLQYNMEEAKKLLSAADHSSFDTTLFFSEQSARTFPYGELVEILPEMFIAGGINTTADPRDYESDYVPNFFRAYVGGSGGGFNGILAGRIAPAVVAGLHMYDLMHPAGRAFAGAPVTATSNPVDGDPELTSLIESYFTKFDLEEQQQVAHEYQRQLAEKAYLIQSAIFTAEWFLTWPVVGNFDAFRTPEAGRLNVEGRLNWWIDETKRPITG